MVQDNNAYLKLCMNNHINFMKFATRTNNDELFIKHFTKASELLAYTYNFVSSKMTTIRLKTSAQENLDSMANSNLRLVGSFLSSDAFNYILDIYRKGKSFRKYEKQMTFKEFYNFPINITYKSYMDASKSLEQAFKEYDKVKERDYRKMTFEEEPILSDQMKSNIRFCQEMLLDYGVPIDKTKDAVLSIIDVIAEPDQEFLEAMEDELNQGIKDYQSSVRRIIDDMKHSYKENNKNNDSVEFEL